MTTEILNNENNEYIDWSNPQWVKTEKGLIVFTNGKHDDGNFDGTALPWLPDYPNGEFCKNWAKNLFKPIPKDGLVIKIKNK